VAKHILCIFCGSKADIVKRNGKSIVLCRHCNRDTDSVVYQKMFDQWLGDLLKKEKGSISL